MFKKRSLGTKTIIQRKWAFPGLIFSLPALLTIIVFVLLPLFMNIGYSLTNYSLYVSEPRFIGFTNFQNIFKDPDFWLVCKNTIKLTLLYVVGLNTLAIVAAILITKVGVVFGNTIKSILYFPCLLAMAAVGYIWRILLSYSNGAVNKFLLLLGLPQEMIPDWLGSPSLVIPSVSIAIIWFALGYYVVIYYAGLISISPDYYEVSDIEGANVWQELRYVTLPMLAPSITINVVLTTMAIISSFDLPQALTNGGGPGKYGTIIPMWIYQMYFVNSQYGKSLALAVILAVVAIIIAAVELKILLKREEF